MEGDSLWDKITFNDRPTPEDVLEASELDRVIVIRIPVESESLPADVLKRKAMAYLAEIGLPNCNRFGRVLPFFDEGDDVKDFQRKVYQYFEDGAHQGEDPWEAEEPA